MKHIFLNLKLLDTTSYDQDCHWLTQGLWFIFFSNTQVTSINKTENQDRVKYLGKCYKSPVTFISI